MEIRGLFAGLATVDILYLVQSFPSAGTKSVARRQEMFAGGPATNAAITFSHLGGQCHLTSAIGDHALTRIIKEELVRFNVAVTDITPRAKLKPALSSIFVTGLTDDRTVVSINASHVELSADAVNKITLPDVDILLLDGHNMLLCQTLARQAHLNGIPVVLDGGSWKKGTAALLSEVDIAICSADFKPPDLDDSSSLLDYLLEQGVTHAAVTRGGKPIEFKTNSVSGLIHIPTVNVVDTLGAGDILHGAFCYYYLFSNGNFQMALQSASRVATTACEYFGTREWMSHWKVSVD